jgi:lysozyme
MSAILPNSGRPRLSSTKLREMIAPFNIDREKYPFVVVGIRGYYLDVMGRKGENDRNIYDDAIFVESIHTMAAFNANTDPSRVRRGVGTGLQKGMASLKTGFWPAYTFGQHRKHKYPSLVQRQAEVTVVRDGSPDYEDTGYFGVNIHRGGLTETNSDGCQTIHPDQWDSFIQTVKDQAKRFFGPEWETITIPYILLANERGQS